MLAFVMTLRIVDWLEDEAKSKRSRTLIHSAHEIAAGGENTISRLSPVSPWTAAVPAGLPRLRE